MMALTVTATRSLHTSILGMHDPIIIAVIAMEGQHHVPRESLEQSFGPFVEWLQNERTTMLQTIVYCQSYTDCADADADVYIYFCQNFGTMFTEPPAAPDITRFRMVAMPCHAMPCSPAQQTQI